ncbi:PEGA domain-containing protein [Oceanithermus sp.]
MSWRKLAVLALVFGLALAQPAPLPRGGTLAGVWIELQGGCDRVLTPGETIAFRAGVSGAAYLYVFDVRAPDVLVRLVPRGEAPVRSAGGGEGVRFPQPGAGVRYQVTGPSGEGYLYLLATRVPLALPPEVSALELARLLDGLDFASWGAAGCRYRVAAPPTAQAVVAIETEPAGLTVYVDGVHLGASPLTASLAPGVHRLRLEGAGALHEQTLRLAPGDRFSLRLRLPIEALPVARFAVSSAPDGAWAYLDGRYVCATPCELEARPGVHLLRLERPGQQVWGAYVRIATQDAASGITVTLKEASATLTVRTDADAALFLDGMPLGWLRAGEARTLPVAPGWHEVVALAPGREAARERILILDGDREEMELDLDAL